MKSKWMTRARILAYAESKGLGQQHCESVFAALSTATFSSSARLRTHRGHRLLVLDPTMRLLDGFVSKTLSRMLQVAPPNRHRAIRGLASVLSMKPQLLVFRGDVSSFYESIKFDTVIERLEADSRMPPIILLYLRYLARLAFQTTGSPGLPRGCAVSAVLSEVYMAEFDRQLKTMSAVLFYDRFVDDFVIVQAPNFDRQDLLLHASEQLGRNGLRLNDAKSTSVTWTAGQSFDFLGYEFARRAGSAGLVVDISMTRMMKIKRRVILSVITACKFGKPKLVEDSLRVLTGNLKLVKRRPLRVARVGLRYNYPCVSRSDGRLAPGSRIVALDTFLRQVLTGTKLPFSKAFAQLLPDRKQLLKYSFRAGYERAIHCRLGGERLRSALEVWRHAK